MTEQQIAELGRAFAHFLGRFDRFFAQRRTAGHFRDFCRGLLSGLPRKSVEPIALAAGTTAHTLQEFLTTATGDYLGLRDALQQHLVDSARAGPVGRAARRGGRGPGRPDAERGAGQADETAHPHPARPPPGLNAPA